MSVAFELLREKARLTSPLEHCPRIEDPREPRRVARPLAQALRLETRATMADDDDCDAIVAAAKRVWRCFVAICSIATAFLAVVG
jgi:hypothetical protein